MMEKIKNNKYLAWLVPIILVIGFIVREFLIKKTIKDGLDNFKKADEESKDVEKNITDKQARADEISKQNEKLENKADNISGDEDWHKKR